MLDEQIDARSPDECLIELILFSHVPEESQTGEKWQLLLLRNPLAQRFDHTVQLVDEQIVLIPIMGVEGGASNVRALDQIIDGDGAIAFFAHQRNEGCTQHMSGPLAAAIVFIVHRMPFCTLCWLCPLTDILPGLMIDLVQPT